MKQKARNRIIFICFYAVLLTGCANEVEPENNIQTEKEEIIEVETVLEKNHVEISVDEGPEGTFYTVPMYFQQEFKNVESGRLNVSENGNLITCLSMLDSFYNSDYIMPDEFVKKYDEYITEDGTYKADEIIQAVAESNNRIVTTVPLDVFTLHQYVRDYSMAVLVHINHASIYGEDSSYILVTGITDEGNLLVRDPNYENVKKYATVYDSGETSYNSFDFFFSAGEDATVYLLGGSYYEIEEGYNENNNRLN